LQEKEYHHRHKAQRLEQCFYYFRHRHFDDGHRFKRHFIIDVCGEVFFSNSISAYTAFAVCRACWLWVYLSRSSFAIQKELLEKVTSHVAMLQTANAVYAEMELLKKTFPADVDYKVPFESVTIIRSVDVGSSKNIVRGAGPCGGGGIPFPAKLALHAYSVLAIRCRYSGRFCFFIPLGFTIKYLTMFGFVLAIGIVGG